MDQFQFHEQQDYPDAYDEPDDIDSSESFQFQALSDDADESAPDLIQIQDTEFEYDVEPSDPEPLWAADAPAREPTWIPPPSPLTYASPEDMLRHYCALHPEECMVRRPEILPLQNASSTATSVEEGPKTTWGHVNWLGAGLALLALLLLLLLWHLGGLPTGAGDGEEEEAKGDAPKGKEEEKGEKKGKKKDEEKKKDDGRDKKDKGEDPDKGKDEEKDRDKGGEAKDGDKKDGGKEEPKKGETGEQGEAGAKGETGAEGKPGLTQEEKDKLLRDARDRDDKADEDDAARRKKQDDEDAARRKDQDRKDEKKPEEKKEKDREPEAEKKKEPEDDEEDKPKKKKKKKHDESDTSSSSSDDSSDDSDDGRGRRRRRDSSDDDSDNDDKKKKKKKEEDEDDTKDKKDKKDETLSDKDWSMGPWIRWLLLLLLLLPLALFFGVALLRPRGSVVAPHPGSRARRSTPVHVNNINANGGGSGLGGGTGPIILQTNPEVTVDDEQEELFIDVIHDAAIEIHDEPLQVFPLLIAILTFALPLVLEAVRGDSLPSDQPTQYLNDIWNVVVLLGAILVPVVFVMSRRVWSGGGGGGGGGAGGAVPSSGTPSDGSGGDTVVVESDFTIGNALGPIMGIGHTFVSAIKAPPRGLPHCHYSNWPVQVGCIAGAASCLCLLII